jgi:hypothetical protein
MTRCYFRLPRWALGEVIDTLAISNGGASLSARVTGPVASLGIWSDNLRHQSLFYTMVGSFVSSLGRGAEDLIFRIANDTPTNKAIPAAM